MRQNNESEALGRSGPESPRKGSIKGFLTTPVTSPDWEGYEAQSGACFRCGGDDMKNFMIIYIYMLYI